MDQSEIHTKKKRLNEITFKAFKGPKPLTADTKLLFQPRILTQNVIMSIKPDQLMYHF